MAAPAKPLQQQYQQQQPQQQQQQQQQRQQQKRVEPKIAGNEKNINEFIEQLTTTLSEFNLKFEELKKLIDSAVHVLPAH